VPQVITDDVSDNHILACALAGRADFIISGDRHLLNLKEYEGIVIERPVDFLRTLGLV
jgi:predicted nucleic acid-binding protein